MLEAFFYSGWFPLFSGVLLLVFGVWAMHKNEAPWALGLGVLAGFDLFKALMVFRGLV